MILKAADSDTIARRSGHANSLANLDLRIREIEVRAVVFAVVVEDEIFAQDEQGLAGDFLYRDKAVSEINPRWHGNQLRCPDEDFGIDGGGDAESGESGKERSAVHGDSYKRKRHRLSLQCRSRPTAETNTSERIVA